MRRRTSLGCLAGALLAPATALAIVDDPSFEETPYATVVTDASVTSMGFAPDGSGRLFVTRKQGELFIVKGGVALPEPFAVVSPTYSANECGLLGVAFDPDFTTNGFVYVFVTVTATEQRILRYRADGDVGRDETVVVGGLPVRGENHDGGALAFGPDGKLYFAIGDLSYDVGHGSDLTSLGSKLARVNRDGTVPDDNPFVDGKGPNQDLIFARGLRNPFTMTFQPQTGRAWVNVVGTAYEQVFALGPGDDAGYPTYESDQPAGYAAPVLSYATNVSEIGGCITGGTFFDSSAASAEYRDNFFFGDFNSGRLTRARVSGSTVSSVERFGQHFRVVDMAIGPDGDLYYVSHSGPGQVMRARFRATEQSLVVAPRRPFLIEGGKGVFHVRLAEPPASTVTVRVRHGDGDESVRVLSGGSLSFDESSWSTPRLVVLAAERDEDATDDVATFFVSSPGLSSESVIVRVHDEWTGELPDAEGGRGGEGGEGGVAVTAGETSKGADGGAGMGGRGGRAAGEPARGGSGGSGAGDSGEGGESGGAMGTAGSRSAGGRFGAGGVAGRAAGRARSARSDGGCGCITAREPRGGFLGVLLVLAVASGRRLQRSAWKRAPWGLCG